MQRRLTADGAEALFVRADVSDVASAQASAAAAIERFGRVDGLVNAAGEVSRGTLLDISAAAVFAADPPTLPDPMINTSAGAAPSTWASSTPRPGEACSARPGEDSLGASDLAPASQTGSKSLTTRLDGRWTTPERSHAGVLGTQNWEFVAQFPGGKPGATSRPGQRLRGAGHGLAGRATGRGPVGGMMT